MSPKIPWGTVLFVGLGIVALVLVGPMLGGGEIFKGAYGSDLVGDPQPDSDQGLVAGTDFTVDEYWVKQQSQEQGTGGGSGFSRTM